MLQAEHDGPVAAAGENDRDLWNELVRLLLRCLAVHAIFMNQSSIIWGYRQELSSAAPCSTGRWTIDLDHSRGIDAIHGAAIRARVATRIRVTRRTAKFPPLQIRLT
jgi:hypothetical protein